MEEKAILGRGTLWGEFKVRETEEERGVGDVRS
jgi:hypothetical protein